MRFNVYVLVTSARYFSPLHKAGFAENADALRYVGDLGKELDTTDIIVVVEGEIKDAKRGANEAGPQL